MLSKKRVEILDTTLREGEQSRGVFFTLKQKIKIAEKLDEFGVDYIELGHPIASKSVFKAVSTVASMGLKAQTFAHARAKKEDIDAVKKCATKWVGIFSGINKYSLKYRLHSNKQKAIRNILDSVKYAKDIGLKVRFTCEDASRTNRNELIELYSKAVEAGTDRISIADTIGILTPTKTQELVNEIKKSVHADIHVHFHNDFGMAVANALVAYESGSRVIDVTINGIGERAGMTSLAEVCIALNQLYGIKKGWNFKLLPELSKMVSNFTKSPIEYSRPIIGRNAFSHKGGIHCAAVLEDPKSYEPFSPKILGTERTIIISKLIGKNGLEGVLKSYTNNNLSRIEVEKIINRLKNNGNKEFTESEIKKAIKLVVKEKR